MSTQTLRGLATVSFFADDLEAAKKWYADLLGIDPYVLGIMYNRHYLEVLGS